MRPIENLIETGVYADDLDQAEWFYGNVLGLPVMSKEAGRHVFFRVGKQSVLLIFHPDATLAGDHLPAHGCRGSGHFALGIDAVDLDAWRAHLVRNQIAIEHEESWPRGGRSLYFRDPAGNLVELITPGIWGLASGW